MVVAAVPSAGLDTVTSGIMDVSVRKEVKPSVPAISTTKSLERADPQKNGRATHRIWCEHCVTTNITASSPEWCSSRFFFRFGRVCCTMLPLFCSTAPVHGSELSGQLWKHQWPPMDLLLAIQLMFCVLHFVEPDVSLPLGLLNHRLGAAQPTNRLSILIYRRQLE